MTTPATSITCPHCGATNVAGAQFCESCGKALPSLYPTGPRVVSADALPQTALGHQLVGGELAKTQKNASTALLVVAIIATAFAGIMYAIAQSSPRASQAMPPAVLAIQGGVAVIFWGLWAWSRKAPLPAAIVGLVLYATLIVLNMIAAAKVLAESHGETRANGIGGLGIGWLDIVILVVLGKGIGAGLKYKRLIQAGAGGAAAS